MDQRIDRVGWVADDEEEPPRKRARKDELVHEYDNSETDCPLQQSDQEYDVSESDDSERDHPVLQQWVCGAVKAIVCNSIPQEEERPVLIREKIRGLIYCEHCWYEYGQKLGYGGEYIDNCPRLRSPLPRGPHPILANTDVTYFEQIDVPRLEAYVAQGIDRRQESAEKYLELAKHYNGKIPQTFRYQEIGFGRRASKGQPSLQTITRECRRAAMIPGQHQIWDIGNCFPNIGFQMATWMLECDHDNQALPTLVDYCRDRNPFLEEIMAIYTYIDTNPPQHCTLTDAKNLFIRILSGGNLCGWKREMCLEARRGHEKFGCVNMPLFMKFLDDCRDVHDIISKARSDLVQWFRNDQRRRPSATAQAYAFQEIEDGALVIVEEEVRQAFGSNSVQTPLFDGLIICPFGASDEAVHGVFQRAENRIYNQLGYRLKFSRKE